MQNYTWEGGKGQFLQPYLNHVLSWHRFIDDLFVIWTGTEQLLKEFVQLLNTNQFNLHFTFTFDNCSISFLDLNISKNISGQLVTDLSCKPTAGYTLLHASSSHPRPLIRSIPYTKYLRLRRNCTEDGDFCKQADALRECLLSLDYSPTNLRKAFKKAFAGTRQSLVYGSPHVARPSTVKIITKFSTHRGQLRSVLSEHWHLLTDHHILGKYVKSTPEMVFRRATTSLRDKLTATIGLTHISRRAFVVPSNVANVPVVHGSRKDKHLHFLMGKSFLLCSMPIVAPEG